jgi:hypothetical protein
MSVVAVPSDLAVVWRNCYVLVQLGGENRPLPTLLKVDRGRD